MKCIFENCYSGAIYEGKYCSSCFNSKVIPTRKRLDKKPEYVPLGRTPKFTHSYGDRVCFTDACSEMTEAW